MGGIISQEELESWMATQEHKARTALERRIEQLEKLNATLAAEVDRMRQLLAREVAADDHDRQWPLRTTMGNIAREGFVSGWDAAMEYVVKERDERINKLSEAL